MLTGYVTNIWHLIIQFVLFIKQDHYLTAIFHSEMVSPEAAGLSAGPAEKQIQQKMGRHKQFWTPFGWDFIVWVSPGWIKFYSFLVFLLFLQQCWMSCHGFIA